MTLELIAQNSEALLELVGKKVETIVNILDKKIEAFAHIITDFTIDTIDALKGTDTYKYARYLSWPFHLIWILVWKFSITAEEVLPFDRDGVMIIKGPPGCGKSSLAFEIAERSRILYNKPFYINTKLEKPRVSIIHSCRFVYHNVFDFNDFWRERRMVKQPNHMIYGGMIIDESHKLLNYRLNGTSDYNDKFMPFMDYAVLVRQKIKKIILLTQMDKVDIQLMQLAIFTCVPRIHIGFNYPEWLNKTGIFRLQILGWYLDFYSVKTEGPNIVETHVESRYLKARYANWDFYDTYSMAGEFEHLPMDMPKHPIRA